MSDDRSTADDVVVIGGGLAGSMAALAAGLDAPDATVRLLVPEPDRFEQETGLLDLLGYSPEGDGPLTDPIATLPELPPSHPYSRVGTAGTRRALSLFEDATDYCGLETEQNALVPTCHGTLKPTYMYPESVASGVASTEEACLLVGIEQIADLTAGFVAEALDDRLPYTVESTTISLPVTEEEQAEPTSDEVFIEQLAREAEFDEPVPIVGGNADETDDDTAAEETGAQAAPVFDRHPALSLADALDENVEFDERLPLRRAVAGKIRNALDIEPRIGFPAVLGLSDSDEVRSDLQSILQADIFEIPLGAPSVLGLRLQAQLRAALEDAGVVLEEDVSITEFDADGDRLTRVSTAQAAHEATQFVLATGGLDAGGLESTAERIVEPRFDCHVPQPDRRTDWVEAEFLDDHPFASLGIQTDEAFRPLDAAGEPVFENLRGAGRILGGGDFAAEQSTSGVAVVTGHHVGTLAVDR